MTDQTPAPTSDERVFAALSHFFGFIVALIIWAIQKDKSRYVRFQSVQALAFDLVVGVTTFLIFGCLMIVMIVVYIIGFGGMMFMSSQSGSPEDLFLTLTLMMTLIPFLTPCVFVPLTGIVFIARLIATIQTFLGKDFHYPWLGNFIERSMDKTG